MTEYLTLEDAYILIRLNELGRVRDQGLLDSALMRPGSSAFGEDAYPTLAMKAAAMLHSLARHHALMDGNKRIALIATLVFLDLNEHRSGLDNPAAVKLILDVATGTADVAEIAERLNISAL